MARKYLGSETYTYKQPGEVRIIDKIEAARVNASAFPMRNDCRVSDPSNTTRVLAGIGSRGR